MLPSKVSPFTLGRTHPVDALPTPGENFCTFPWTFGFDRLAYSLARSAAIGV
jgi:hypothetical protein